ncbi:chemotaxis protein CheW [Lysobacter sp. FW306-1B-D06B]|uniref:chemotaxis protein CheW n=1 Tax=Lysobacter sp. FW306-1B-D06B TaxID=3140250 RepID=UPI00314093AE
MTHPAIDAYLDELLDLTVDAVAPVPAAANAPVMAHAVEAVMAHVEIPAGLLAELDADPLLTGPLAAGTHDTTTTSAVIPAGLLDELDADPLFAGQAPAPETAPTFAIPAGLLDELDSDPLFADASPTQAAGIPPGLLAELDADPLFDAPPPVVAEAPRPQPAPAPARSPAPPPRAPAAAQAHTGLRPVELTPPSLPPTVTTTHRWLRVAVGEDSYAVELLRVQEVGRTVPIVAMRGAAPSVLGAMNLRGRIVPVFDLGLWLGTERVTPDERARIVVVERDNELIGALVSAVDDVVTLGPDRIEPPLMASPSKAIVGVARVVAKPTVLLDANALFG